MAVVCLVGFFVGLIQNIRSLALTGALNDTLNAVTGFLSALLASGLHPGPAQAVEPATCATVAVLFSLLEYGFSCMLGEDVVAGSVRAKELRLK